MEFDESNEKSIYRNAILAETPIIKTPEPLNEFRETYYSAMQQEKIMHQPIKDNKCTRLLRKKFFCIVIFFLFCIALFEFFTAVTEKLSENHISEMFYMLSNTVKKILYLHNSNIYNITEEIMVHNYTSFDNFTNVFHNISDNSTIEK